MHTNHLPGTPTTTGNFAVAGASTAWPERQGEIDSSTTRSRIFWNSATLRLLLALIGYKIVFFAVIFVMLRTAPAIDQSGYESNLHWPLEGSPTLATAFATWDGAHYLLLSEHGYQPGSMSCEFYPLWPMLIRTCSGLLFHDSLWTGLVLANVFSIFGILLFHHFVRFHHGPQTANFAVGLLLLFPGAIFFGFIYTEALFFFLAVLFFQLLFKQNHAAVALVGGLLALCRPIGILCVVPLLAYLYVNRQPARRYVALAGPLLGWAAYFVFMYHSTGNPFEGFRAARQFVNEPSVANILDVFGFLDALIMPVHFHGMTDSAIDRGFFLMFAASLFWIWRLGPAYFLFALLAGLIPAMSSHFFSYSRYIMMCFPLFIVLANYFKNRQRRFEFAVFALLMLYIQALFLWRHVHFAWAA